MLVRLFILSTWGLLTTPFAYADPLPSDWAFQPLSNPKPPATGTSNAVGNPIDAFVQAKLSGHGLAYAPPAERATLLRRVTFDLIGLPPTRAEIEAFVQDPAIDAYERVVERLLASPHYGERMALYWLDLVRFAESDGFKADDPRPLAWRYRDYVIDAFNADKPYDRFIIEQIAGDEYFPHEPDAWVATGMHRHYPDEYNAVNLEQRRQEILNDITDTTATTFLGLTVGCAKCHDHKFDPITQKDYYRLQAFFAGWWPNERILLPAAERTNYQQRQQSWEGATAVLRHELKQLEAPHRTKHAETKRKRFPLEYAQILDIPYAERTPLQKQIGTLIEPQVAAIDQDLLKRMNDKEKKRWKALKAEMSKLAATKPSPPLGMVFTDLGTSVPATHLLRSGNWRTPGPEVTPGFLSVLDHQTPVIPKQPATTGRRSVLAAWLTQPDHPLTSRVMVNRLWQQHFGQGLVATSDDFGAQGARPSHPDLLDWLAQTFVRSGWSIKAIHRLIVTSQAYQQGNTWNAQAAAMDPNNRLLWRMNRRRLEGETLRDAILAVNGSLSKQMHGPSVFPELPGELKRRGSGWTVSKEPADRARRSVYVFVKRNLRLPLFALFDAPDRTETCSRRYATTTAPQALMLMNESLILQAADTFACAVIAKVGRQPAAMIETAFQQALGRSPTSIERHQLHTFFLQQRQQLPPTTKDKTQQAMADLCHVLLNINEFLYID